MLSRNLCTNAVHPPSPSAALSKEEALDLGRRVSISDPRIFLSKKVKLERGAAYGQSYEPLLNESPDEDEDKEKVSEPESHLHSFASIADFLGLTSHNSDLDRIALPISDNQFRSQRGTQRFLPFIIACVTALLRIIVGSANIQLAQSLIVKEWIKQGAVTPPAFDHTTLNAARVLATTSEDEVFEVMLALLHASHFSEVVVQLVEQQHLTVEADDLEQQPLILQVDGGVISFHLVFCTTFYN